MVKGLLDYPILFLSCYVMINKEDYYAGLSGISQRGSWKNLLLYMLKAIVQSSDLTYYKINDIIAAKEAILTAIIEGDNRLRPETLVSALFSQPYPRVKDITTMGLYSENTAKKYLDQLAALGILEKRTIQDANYYLNMELYRISFGIKPGIRIFFLMIFVDRSTPLLH